MFYLDTTEGNKSCLLNFAGQICQISDSLTTLKFDRTFSSAQDGDIFMQTLAGSGLKTLKKLVIVY